MSPTAAPVPRAATILLAHGPGSPEVYVVRRAETLRFLGGFHAFPGGRVHPSDAALTGPPPCPPPAAGEGGGGGVAVQRVAAVRELFEEAGVLLARRADGSISDDAALAGPRRELLADSAAFPALLRRLGLTIRPTDLDYVGTLITPPFSAVRFDTAFFTAVAPPGQTPTVQVGELDAGEWLSADAALRVWEQGRSLLAPPTISLLETIRGRPIAELLRRARPLFEALAAGAPEVIYFSPQVQMAPLFCTGLPPTHYTNAFLVGHDPAYLIDPGPADPAEQQRLFTLLDARRATGARLAGVLLTHHHPDHVGAANAVAGRYGVPILAHPWTARRWRAACGWSGKSATAMPWTSARPRTAGRGGWRRSTRLATPPATSVSMRRLIASCLSATWPPRFPPWSSRRRKATLPSTWSRCGGCGSCRPGCCCRPTAR